MSDPASKANWNPPETPKKGTYNELLRLIRANFDLGLRVKAFTALAGSSTFGHVFVLWEDGRYLPYLITDLDSSTVFSTA